MYFELLKLYITSDYFIGQSRSQRNIDLPAVKFKTFPNFLNKIFLLFLYYNYLISPCFSSLQTNPYTFP